MSQDPNITLARGLYNACTLATAQIREAQSLAKEIFPGVEASRAEVLGIDLAGDEPLVYRAQR